MTKIINIVLSSAVLALNACSTTETPAPEHAEALLHVTSNQKIHQGYVNGPEGQIHYWKAGNGPALLLVHQSASSSEEYAGLVDYLASDYTLISYDWPGHGMSDDPKREFGVEDFSQGALLVLDELNIQKAHILGHHGGALVAMNLAWKNPDRFEKLILSGTSGLKSTEETQKFATDLDLKKRYTLDRDGNSLDAAWQRFIGYMPNSSPEEIIRPYVTSVVRRVRPYDAHYGVLRYNRKPAIDAIKNRHILLMQGENDAFVENQEALLSLFKNAERVVVKNSGTFLFYESPEATSKIISSYLSKP